MSKKNQTILIVTSHYPPNMGGVESHLQALVAALVNQKWKVIVSTYQPLAVDKRVPIVQNGSKITVYRMPWIGFNIVHKLTPYPALEFAYLFPGLLLITFVTLIKHFDQIEVLHCQGLVPTAVGVILGRIFGKKVISSTHNLYFFPLTGMYTFFAKNIFSLSDKVLVPTKIASKELISIGVPEGKIFYFRYWLDLNQFRPVPKLEAKKLTNWKKFTIFFVGRLIETKGVKLLLEVVKNLNPEINLVIAGDGALREDVEKAQKNNSNLTYLGRVENHNLPLYYSAADLVLFPSLVDEGWGFVAMEAISCGTPVIASNKGGLSDVVSKECGELVNPKVKDFQGRIEYYFYHPKELSKLALASRPYAEKKFSEKSIQIIIEAYEQ